MIKTSKLPLYKYLAVILNVPVGILFLFLKYRMVQDVGVWDIVLYLCG